MGSGKAKPAGRVSLKTLMDDWAVDQKTALHWRRTSLPIESKEKLARALLRRRKTPTQVRERAIAILRKASGDSAADAKKLDRKLDQTSLGMVEDLEREATRYQAMQKAATVAGDFDRESWALTERMKIYRTLIAIRKELRRLGEDQGKVIGREEAERLIEVIGARASKGAARIVGALGEKLLDLDRLEKVAAILEPQVLLKMFIEPFAEAVLMTSKLNLPTWVAEKLRATCGDFVANGEAHLAEAGA